MDEMTRIERAAPVLDLLEYSWALRQELQKAMVAANRNKAWAKTAITKGAYAAQAHEYGSQQYALDEAMTQWVQWLLSRKLVSQAQIFEAMGARTKHSRNGKRGEIIKAGRDLARERRPKNLVEAPPVEDHLKNRVLEKFPSKKYKAALLREMYEARQKMRSIGHRNGGVEYEYATREFQDALTEVWDYYTIAELMRVCKTSSAGWLTRQYDAGLQRRERA